MSDLWSRLHTHLDKLHLPNGNRFERYGFVIVLVSVFYLIKATLIQSLGAELPFLFSLFIVVMSAWFGGFGPGILATLLTSLIIFFFFLDPKFSFLGGESLSNMIIISVHILQGFFISMLSESHRKSDVQKSEFLGIISHELKNPLTSIKGYTDIIKYHALRKRDKKLEDYAKKIDAKVLQVTDMINETLDMTTIETGRLSYHDELFGFMDLVKARIADQQVTTDTHKIVSSGKTAKKVYGDKYRIGQVITNLLSNAIKYSPDAKTVKVIVKNYPGGVELQVQDKGPGIPKPDQKNIFKPFFRLKKTQRAKGTGIGLFISAQIIERHKGSLWVESEPGKGSIFIFRLPQK